MALPLAGGRIRSARRETPRLCGWESLGEFHSEATFSRAFDAFARDGRPQQIHEATIKAHYGEKIAGRIVGFYDLADAAYDAKEICAMSARLGHAPIEATAEGGRSEGFCKRLYCCAKHR